MLNFIGMNFKICMLGQKDYFWKVVIYNGFVYHVAPVMISNFANMIFANYMYLILIL